MKVVGGWQWFLSEQQEDPADAAALVRDYIDKASSEIDRRRIITYSEWIESVDLALNYRSFFGVLSGEQLSREAKQMALTEPVRTYMVYLSNTTEGNFYFLHLVESEEHGKYATQNHCDRFAECLTLMFKHGLDKQYDRGKGLMFSATARRRATAAIECWMMLAKRLRVVRDIRVLIAKKVWANRHVWIN